MCHVITIRPVEDCLEGGRVQEFELDAPLDEQLMERLAVGGELDYYPQFPRPYFRIQHARDLRIQGVVGTKTFRVTFPRPQCAEVAEKLRRRIERIAVLSAAP